MTKQELLDAAKKTAAAPSCYPGLKALIEAWEKALGTPEEHCQDAGWAQGVRIGY